MPFLCTTPQSSNSLKAKGRTFRGGHQNTPLFQCETHSDLAGGGSGGAADENGFSLWPEWPPHSLPFAHGDMRRLLTDFLTMDLQTVANHYDVTKNTPKCSFMQSVWTAMCQPAGAPNTAPTFVCKARCSFVNLPSQCAN